VSPRLAADIDWVRWYRHPTKHQGGYVYISVTNATGSLPKPALLRWASKETAIFAVEQLQAWQHMPAMEAVDWLKGAPWRTRDRAASRGTTIHAVVENILHGRDYDVEVEAEPWIGSVQRFIKDARPKPEHTEATGFNDKHLFAGTFDFIGRLEAAPELGRCLLDWKTSRGVYADMGVQLAAYTMFEYLVGDDDREMPFRPPDTAAIVHFTPDGYTLRKVPLDPLYRRAFIACLEIRRWEQKAPPIDEPYQMRLDLEGPALGNLPTNAELDHLRSRVRALDYQQQLQLMEQALTMSLPTKFSNLSVQDYDRLLGLVGLFEMGKATDDQEPKPRRRASRPMP
jgi:hypothetical protein